MAIISWDWTTTIWEYVGNFCGGLIRKKSDVEYAAKGMSSDEIEQANRDKARRYFNLVLLGATSILWGDITTAINKINSPTAVTAFGIYLNFVLVSIFGGAIAAVFPDLTRHYLSVSGNGVLQSFIFAILVFNIDILSSVSVSGALYELSWWVTCFVSVSAITIYWTMSTEDPMVSAMAHDNSKPFLDKVKDFWIDVSTRESQVVKDNNGNQIEKNNKERSRLYCKLIMMLALSSVFWSGAKNAVSKLKGSVLCVASIYINFALISMMIGAAAGTIPDVFRWHLGLSGNGVLQGLLFNIIAFNCELFTSLMADSLDKLHQIVLYWVTGGTSAVAVTIIWTWTTEDPLCALVALRIIWRFLQWIICSISSCICGMATKKLKKQVNQNDDQTLKDSLVNRTEAAHDSGCP